jgi:hypothetical protein
MHNRYTHCPTWMLVIGPGLAMLVSILIPIIVASGFLPPCAPAGVILFLPFIPYFILACIRLRGLLGGYAITDLPQKSAQTTQRQVVDNEQMAGPP